MKLPTGPSLLLATLAVSSSSSVLGAPAADGSQDHAANASSTALVSSSSSGSIAPQETRPPERDVNTGSDSERNASLISDLGGIIKNIIHTLDPLAAPPSGSREDEREATQGPVSGEKAQAMLSQPTSALENVTPSPLGSPPLSGTLNNSSATPHAGGTNAGASSNNTRIPVASFDGSTNSTNSSVPISMSNMSSTPSSSAWRVQPTPANSPTLPVDYPQTTGNETSSSSSPSATSFAPNSAPTAPSAT